MAEQDFSKVVQQLQLANQKLANLERIQGEGGTAKGIIAAALPEILNERELFGRDKEFQKDQGITNIDEEQKETTRVLADKQDALKRAIDGGLQNVAESNFIGPRTLEQQIEEVKIQRAESREDFRQLKEIIGDNAKAIAEFQEIEKGFNEKLLELELQKPDLNPSLRKEREKELANSRKRARKVRLLVLNQRLMLLQVH